MNLALTLSVPLTTLQSSWFLFGFVLFCDINNNSIQGNNMAVFGSPTQDELGKAQLQILFCTNIDV